MKVLLDSKREFGHLVGQYPGDSREVIREVRGPPDLLFLDGAWGHYDPCFLSRRLGKEPARAWKSCDLMETTLYRAR